MCGGWRQGCALTRLVPHPCAAAFIVQAAGKEAQCAALFSLLTDAACCKQNTGAEAARCVSQEGRGSDE